ncbi:MAG: DNA polymerase III subunit beta [Alphaproteobacteria bacterium]|nr:DNA polymerase III subunit beta [Alphaproteobacteria bacterium]MCB9794543.1 DNA polymerase III subunit beta [Alphaproteobacteria bacterium]
MELYIDRDALTTGLTRVQGIVERRNTPNPILSHVLLEASGERLRMTATDTEMTFIGDFPANVISPGEISVDAASLFQIAKVLPDATAHLTLGGQNRLELTSGSAWYKVVGLPAEDYPSPQNFDGQTSMTLKAQALRWLIERTAFVVCPDDNRYGINGAHLEVHEANDGSPRLRMVATDGHRLSYGQAPFEGSFGMAERMLIPRKALAEMKKLCERLEGEVQLSFGENGALLTTPAARFYFRLIDGEFPDYRKVVPTTHQRQVTANRDVLFNALRRVGVLAQDRGRPVRFDFEPEHLTITASNTDLGEAREQVPLELTGGGVSIGFNIRYFQEVLGALASERVIIELGDALSPAILREPGSEDSLLIVMPMRLD